MNVLDLFCGCGGLSNGFKQAGFNIDIGIDIDEDSVATYSKNFPNSEAICKDITNFSKKEIKKIFAHRNIDVLVGGPPCQGFSSANRWDKEKNDPRNKLFLEYFNFIDALKPKVVLIENVRGILTMNNGYTKNKIIGLFKDSGFKLTHAATLNSADFGVPQNRIRAFFIAVQEKNFDRKIDIYNSSQIKGLNVKDALGELYTLEKKDLREDFYILKNSPDTSYRRYLRSRHNKIYNHEVKYPAEVTQEKISYVPQGGNWRDIPNHILKSNRTNRHSSAYRRLDEEHHSVTIDTGNSHSNYFHPTFNRIPSVREAARIQSFKDNFIFLGPRGSQYRQVGNAVPPLLAKGIAKAIKKEYFN